MSQERWRTCKGVEQIAPMNAEYAHNEAWAMEMGTRISRARCLADLASRSGRKLALGTLAGRFLIDFDTGRQRQVLLTITEASIQAAAVP